MGMGVGSDGGAQAPGGYDYQQQARGYGADGAGSSSGMWGSSEGGGGGGMGGDFTVAGANVIGGPPAAPPPPDMWQSQGACGCGRCWLSSMHWVWNRGACGMLACLPLNGLACTGLGTRGVGPLWVVGMRSTCGTGQHAAASVAVRSQGLGPEHHPHALLEPHAQQAPSKWTPSFVLRSERSPSSPSAHASTTWSAWPALQAGVPRVLC